MSDRKMLPAGSVHVLPKWFALLTCDRQGQEYIASAGRFPDALAKYGDKAYGGGNWRVVEVTLKVQIPVSAGPAAKDDAIPF